MSDKEDKIHVPTIVENFLTEEQLVRLAEEVYLAYLEGGDSGMYEYFMNHGNDDIHPDDIEKLKAMIKRRINEESLH